MNCQIPENDSKGALPERNGDKVSKVMSIISGEKETKKDIPTKHFSDVFAYIFYYRPQ